MLQLLREEATMSIPASGPVRRNSQDETGLMNHFKIFEWALLHKNGYFCLQLVSSCVAKKPPGFEVHNFESREEYRRQNQDLFGSEDIFG